MIELNVGAGYVAGVVERFQRELVVGMGVAFARRMQCTECTDSEIAAAILNAKHAPSLPPVSIDTGYAPLPDAWANSMDLIEGWVRPHDEQMAVAVRQVKENHAVPDDQLAVPPGNVRSIALGSVLRGKCGMGEMHRVLPEAVSARGDGLDMLRSVQGTVFADLEDSMVSDWQHPVPVTELHHVEAAVMEWGKKRSKLRKLKRMMVDDPVVAKASLEQLLGGSAVVKAIVSNLKLQHGSKMTVQQILDRVAVDSGAWLAEHNATAVLHGSGSGGKCSSCGKRQRQRW